MIVVSNTSPILNLAAIGHLELLQQLYRSILIPQAVFDEIVVAGAGQPGALEVQQSKWIRKKPVTNHTVARALLAEIDAGEAEAIALAVEEEADLLLLDERRGRVVAARLGLRFVGLLGVLVEAKNRGHISSAKTILDELIVIAGFWVNQDLYARVLQAVQE